MENGVHFVERGVDEVGRKRRLPWRLHHERDVPLHWATLSILLVMLGLGAKPAAGTAPAAKVYRISGVAVNGRDGSPIARCRISVAETVRGVNVGTEGGGEVPGGGPGFGRFGPGGSGGGRPGGGGPRRGQDADGSEDPEPVITDARGRFSVVVAHAGTYRLSGSARGFQQQSYEQRERGFFAGVVLSPAAPETNVTLKLTADAAISGIVFDESGDGVRNAQVQVEPVRTVEPNQGQGGRGRGQQSVQTDDRGHYELAPLAPGRYRLRVNAHPWYATGATGARPSLGMGGTQAASTPALDPSLDVVYAEMWYPAATDAESAETITLSGGEERQADFHLTPIPSIHLRVPRQEEAGVADGRRGQAAPLVMRADGPGGFGVSGMQVTTTSHGDWDIGGLSPGTYQVRMVGSGGGAATVSQVSLGGSQTVVGLGSATVSVPVSITVEGVPDRSVRQVTLLDAATGQVYGTNGGRARRVPERDGDEDEEGDGRSVQVPPGRYEVYLSGAPGLFLTGLTATGAEAVGRTVTVGGPAKLTVHAATGLAQVEGVVRRDGKPVVGGLVLLVPAGYGRPDNVAPVREDETNTDGSYAVRGVFPGGYIVVAIDGGWGVNWRDATTLMGYLGKGAAVDLKGDAVVKKDLEGVGP